MPRAVSSGLSAPALRLVAQGHHLSGCGAAHRELLCFHSLQSCPAQTFHPRLPCPRRPLPGVWVAVVSDTRGRVLGESAAAATVPDRACSGASSWLAHAPGISDASSCRWSPTLCVFSPPRRLGRRREGVSPLRLHLVHTLAPAWVFFLRQKNKLFLLLLFLFFKRKSEPMADFPSFVFSVPDFPHTSLEKGAGLKSCSC